MLDVASRLSAAEASQILGKVRRQHDRQMRLREQLAAAERSSSGDAVFCGGQCEAETAPPSRSDSHLTRATTASGETMGAEDTEPLGAQHEADATASEGLSRCCGAPFAGKDAAAEATADEADSAPGEADEEDDVEAE